MAISGTLDKIILNIKFNKKNHRYYNLRKHAPADDLFKFAEGVNALHNEAYETLEKTSIWMLLDEG